jgi:eukaryotic-like serine/threonine-protein kinase
MAEAPAHIGRFRIVGLLGKGAMGVVYRARDDTLDRDVAVKVMRSDVADPDSLARFRREARAAARLQHPNIVTVYELGESEGDLFLAMELLTGQDLHQAMRDGRSTPAAAASIVLQLLDGLGHAHERGIVHRDVKPSNVFLLEGRRVKVLDFGVARLGGSFTATGHVLGTPNYMSPEQVRAEAVDGRSDLFSAGLILYELVTGQKAYQADSLTALLVKIAQEPPDLSRLPVGREWTSLRQVIERALARERDERYPDAEAMAIELRTAVGAIGRDVQPVPPTVIAAPKPILQTAAPQELDLPLRLEQTEMAPTYRPEMAATQRAATPPTVRTLESEATRPPSTDVVLPDPDRWRRGWAVGIGLGVVALAATGVVAWRLRSAPAGDPAVARSEAPAVMPARIEAGPMPIATLPIPAAPTTTVPVVMPTARPGAELPSARPAAPAPPLRSEPVAPSRPAEPAAAEGRLERANQLYESGHLQSALREAQAALRADPANREAATLVEDIQVDVAVEGHLRAARQALARGDLPTARREVEEGLQKKPFDSRLTALRRQLPP